MRILEEWIKWWPTISLSMWLGAPKSVFGIGFYYTCGSVAVHD